MHFTFFHPFTVSGLISLHYCVKNIILLYLFPQTSSLRKQIKQTLTRFNIIDSAPRQWQSNQNLKISKFPFLSLLILKEKNLIGLRSSKRVIKATIKPRCFLYYVGIFKKRLVNMLLAWILFCFCIILII